MATMTRSAEDVKCERWEAERADELLQERRTEVAYELLYGQSISRATSAEYLKADRFARAILANPGAYADSPIASSFDGWLRHQERTGIGHYATRAVATGLASKLPTPAETEPTTDPEDAVREGRASVRPNPVTLAGMSHGERTAYVGAAQASRERHYGGPIPSGSGQLTDAARDAVRSDVALAYRVLMLARGNGVAPTVVGATSPTPQVSDPHVAPVVIRIDASVYAVKPLEWSDRSYRLTKADGTAYDLEQTPDGPTCDCPDYTFRCEGTGAICKHGRALVRLGLMSPASSYATA